MEFNATLIGEMIAFACLIWFCVQFIWPYLDKAIEERQRKIADGLSAAERAQTALKEADAQVASEMRRARQQAGDIIDKARQQAVQILDKARADAITEAERRKALAHDEIVAMTQHARDMLRVQVGQLAAQGASKIVQREIDPATHRALLDQLVAGM